MPVQSRQTNVQVLQSRYVTGGNAVSSGTLNLSVPTGLSILYTPTPGFSGELEISAMLDGIVRRSGAGLYLWAELWKNNVSWKAFGGPAGYSTGGFTELAISQVSGLFRDLIPANSAPILYSLYFTPLGLGPGTINVNWQQVTASYIKIEEILQP